jgi:hypothetical protein
MDVLVYLRGVCIICFNRRKVDFGQVYNNRAYLEGLNVLWKKGCRTGISSIQSICL